MFDVSSYQQVNGRPGEAPVVVSTTYHVYLYFTISIFFTALKDFVWMR
jgi:hypothetical protein